MKLRALIVTFFAVLVVLPLHFNLQAKAQTAIAKNVVAKAEMAVKKIKTSCVGDIKNFCPKVTLGEGRLGFCIMAHENQISDKCYYAVFDVVDSIGLAVSNLRRGAEVCKTDIDKICGKVEAGEGRIAQCLIDNKSKLAAPCRAEVAGFEARMKK